MSSSKNWDVHNRKAKLDYVPAPGARPTTLKQENFIKALAKQKGVSVKIPKTMRGAGNAIDRLQLLPDAKVVYRMEEDLSSRPQHLTPQQVMIQKLRDRFPRLSPMMVNGLTGISYQVEGIDHEAVFAKALRPRKLPEDPTMLMLVLERRLLDATAECWFLAGSPS